MQHYGKTVTAIIVKLPEQTDNGCRIMILNSPGGSTVQWGVERQLTCQHHVPLAS